MLSFSTQPMSTPQKYSEKFIISLQENGLHSLWRGIESYGTYEKTGNKLTLKDAIMFLHHGVELLTKEILIKHSPFLIFEDLRDAATKQKQADDSGVSIFFLEKPPKTVTYDEAIKRVIAFVKPPELTGNLQTNLNKLNQFRNQLEHYAIEADKDEIIQLLAALHEPLLELFDNQIGGVRKHQPVRVAQVWDKVQDSAKFYSELEKKAFDLIVHFKDQKVPGRLFGVEGEFTLPSFTKVLPNQRISAAQGVIREVDILGEGQGFRWVVEIKGTLRLGQRVIDQVHSLGYLLKAQPWLIAFTDLNESIKESARAYGVFITGINEWEELEQLILAQNHDS